MYKFLPVCLALIAGVAAYPSPRGPSGGEGHGAMPGGGMPGGGMPGGHMDDDDAGRTEYLATFEDIDGTGLGAGGEIGPYDGLTWTNWGVATGGGLLGDTVIPVSPDTLAQSIDSQDASMSTQYQGSVTNVFDLHSLYVACGTDGVLGLLGGPEPCVLSIVGYKASVEVARQTVAYVVPADNSLLNLGGNGSNMRFVNLSDDFKGLDTVRVFTRTTDTVDIYIDNVRYSVFNAESEH